ncbi:MAG: inositol monophosphatase family protein [Spirosomataceae bacterium]
MTYDLQALCEQTIQITKQAGLFIKTEAEKFNTEAVEYKGVNNVVSYVDKEAENMLVAGLGAILPEAGFITEEATVASDRSKEWVWIIDPLDGTANFVHGLPLYSVSVGLMHQGKVVVGVIYHIPANECYYAWQGGGAFCNGNPIYVSKAKSLGESLLATGFPYYEFSKMPEYLDILQHLMRETHGLRRLGSAAIDLALVAKGQFEGFYEYNLNSWDMAAGILLVQEAGGQVSDFSGGENFLFGGDIIASNSLIHPEFLSAIQSRWN